MRYLLLLIVSVCLTGQGFCYTFTTYEPPEVTQGGYTSYPKISKLESIILKKTYENEDIETRLQRLEKKACKQIFSGADLAWRVDNLTSKIDQSELYNIPSKELAQIEKRILGRSYTRDNLESRLARLEHKMLGASQSGKPDERYQILLTASNHYTDFGNNATPFDTTLTTGGTGFKNSLQNFFGSIFSGGCMTGYTPAISPYGYSAPYGFNPRYGTYGPITPSFGSFPHRNIGCRNHFHPHSTHSYPTFYNGNRSCGGGCGIHILD